MSTHSSAPDKSALIKIAELKKPYGIKGWLWVFSYTASKEDIFAISPWWMKTAQGLKPITVTNWRKQGNGLVAQFEQVADRTIAESMLGVTIWADKSDMPALDADEYYWSDLIGLKVYNEQGVYFGQIKELFETGANDVMVVVPTDDSTTQEQSQERLIPWHKTTVHLVDIAEAKVVVDWQLDY